MSEITTVTRAFKSEAEIIAETIQTGDAAPVATRTLYGRPLETSDTDTLHVCDGSGRAVSQTVLSAATDGTLSQTDITFDKFDSAVTNTTAYEIITKENMDACIENLLWAFNTVNGTVLKITSI